MGYYPWGHLQSPHNALNFSLSGTSPLGTFQGFLSLAWVLLLGSSLVTSHGDMAICVTIEPPQEMRVKSHICAGLTPIQPSTNATIDKKIKPAVSNRPGE